MTDRKDEPRPGGGSRYTYPAGSQPKMCGHPTYTPGCAYCHWRADEPLPSERGQEVLDGIASKAAETRDLLRTGKATDVECPRCHERTPASLRYCGYCACDLRVPEAVTNEATPVETPELNPGLKFRRARVRAGKSLREIAGVLGITATRLGEYERGVSTPLDWGVLYAALNDECRPSEATGARPWVCSRCSRVNPSYVPQCPNCCSYKPAIGECDAQRSAEAPKFPESGWDAIATLVPDGPTRAKVYDAVKDIVDPIIAYCDAAKIEAQKLGRVSGEPLAEWIARLPRDVGDRRESAQITEERRHYYEWKSKLDQACPHKERGDTYRTCPECSPSEVVIKKYEAMAKTEMLTTERGYCQICESTAPMPERVHVVYGSTTHWNGEHFTCMSREEWRRMVVGQ